MFGTLLIAALVSVTASNEVERVPVDWARVVDVRSAVVAAAKELPAEDVDGRRELATKYTLLTDATDALALCGAEPYAVPIVRVSTLHLGPIRLESVELTALRFVPVTPDMLRIDALGIPYVVAQGITVPFVAVDDEGFLAALSAWERRWGVVVDALGPGATRVVPHGSTELGIRRRALMERLEREGWNAETEQAWTEYYATLATALQRRERLGVVPAR